MKILALSSIQYPGFLGDSIRLPSLAENLVKQGHEFHLFVASRTVLRDCESSDKKGFQLHYSRPMVRVRRRGLKKLKSHIFYLLLRAIQIVLTIIKVTIRLAKFCKRHQIDVLICYMPYRDMLIPAVVCKFLFKFPLMVDYCDLYYCDPLERLFLRFADSISFITLPIKQVIVSRYQIKQEKLFYLPNGVDLRLFSKPKVVSRLFPNRKMVLYVGDLYTLDILIGAAPYITEKYSDAIFVIIGNEKNAMWEKKVKEKGLSKCFHFVGLVPHSEVPRYIFQADICVNTFSRQPYFEHALPIKLFEYMACEKPIVATRLAGTEEAVKHGFNGFLADPESPVEFASCVNSLLSDEKLRREMGSRGRRFVQSFAWTAISRRLENKLLEML